MCYSDVSLCLLAGLCVPRHCGFLLPQRLGGSGQSHAWHEGRDKLPELSVGHLSGGEAAAAAAVSEACVVCTRSSDRVCVCHQVFSYVATLLYFIHTILSAIRWKSFWAPPAGQTWWLHITVVTGACSSPVQWRRCSAACYCCLRVSLLLYFYMFIMMSLIKTGSQVGFNLKELNLHVMLYWFFCTHGLNNTCLLLLNQVRSSIVLLLVLVHVCLWAEVHAWWQSVKRISETHRSFTSCSRRHPVRAYNPDPGDPPQCSCAQLWNRLRLTSVSPGGRLVELQLLSFSFHVVRNFLKLFISQIIYVFRRWKM